MKDALNFLEQDVLNLKIDQVLRSGCKRMGFNKISEILRLSPEELIRKEGFTFQWLSELTGFMQAQGALHLLQNLPQGERTSG